jgi:putative FmdB family regulatory protein
MPIYEYCCNNCHDVTEKLQKISEVALTVCEKCGEATLVKQVSASSFRLKGDGWYETDFKKGNNKNDTAQTSSEN